MNKTVYVASAVIFSTLFAVPFSTQSFSQDADGPDILSKMRSFDEAFLQAQTLVVSIEAPAIRDNEYEKGQKITKITTTSYGGAIAVEREIAYTDTPAYREKTPATEIDYRPDGRLIVWRHTRERSLLESDFQGHSDELTCVLVSPNGQTTEFEAGNPSFDLYQPSDSRRHLFMWIPIWSTGRGFASSLSRITEVRQSEDGLISFHASGFLNQQIQGTWRMVVDPQTAYLVRSASFTAAEGARPSFVCTTSGTKWFDSCSLAERASISRGYDLVDQTVRTATIEQYKAQPDTALFDNVRKILRGPLPKGARVYDWVIDPENVFAYSAGELPISDKDLLDSVKDGNAPGTPNNVSANTKNDSLRGSNERSGPSDQRNSGPLPANPRKNLMPYWIAAVVIVAIVIFAVGASLHGKSNK